MGPGDTEQPTLYERGCKKQKWKNWGESSSKTEKVALCTLPRNLVSVEKGGPRTSWWMDVQTDDTMVRTKEMCTPAHESSICTIGHFDTFQSVPVFQWSRHFPVLNSFLTEKIADFAVSEIDTFPIQP